MMNAIVARMQARILACRYFQQWMRIVRPKAAPWCAKLFDVFSFARNDHAAGTFQAYVTILVSTDSPDYSTINEGIFRQEKVCGKAVLGQVGIIIPVLQANAYGIHLCHCLYIGKNAPNRISYVPRLVEYSQDIPAHFPIGFRKLLVGDVPNAFNGAYDIAIQVAKRSCLGKDPGPLPVQGAGEHLHNTGAIITGDMLIPR